MLPIDQLIQPLTKEQIKDSIYRLMTASGLPITSWQEGAVARTIVAIIAAIFAGFTQVVTTVVRSNFLDLAEGIWLTLLAHYVYGVQRIEATFASGEVQLVNTGGGLFSFGAGEFICKNPTTGKQYRNISAFTLNPGQTLSVDVIAFEAGSASSSSAGEITEIVTTMLQVTCNNPAALIGRDEESDPALRQRCRDSLGALSPNGPQAAYEYWAKSALRADGQPVNVNRVWVSKASSVGHVTVYVASPSGAVPGTIGDDSTDLGAVDKAIQSKVVPLGVMCTVASAIPKTIAVTGTAWVQSAANLGDAEWQAMFYGAIDSYLAETPIGGYVLTSPPGHVFQNAIIGIVEGVSKFIVHFEPTGPGDTSLAEGEVPVPGAHSITVLRVAS